MNTHYVYPSEDKTFKLLTKVVGDCELKQLFAIARLLKLLRRFRHEWWVAGTLIEDFLIIYQVYKSNTSATVLLDDDGSISGIAFIPQEAVE